MIFLFVIAPLALLIAWLVFERIMDSIDRNEMNRRLFEREEWERDDEYK